MRFMLFELPIIILLIGAFLGRARIGNALWFMFGVIVVAQVLTFTSFITMDATYFVTALVISMFGALLSVAFSFATSEQVSPAPVDHVVEGAKRGYEAYQALPPERKEALHRGILQGLRFGAAFAKRAAPHVAEHLRKKNRHTLAGIVEDGSKAL